jgi:hypothetical protein
MMKNYTPRGGVSRALLRQHVDLQQKRRYTPLRHMPRRRRSHVAAAAVVFATALCSPRSIYAATTRHGAAADMACWCLIALCRRPACRHGTVMRR